MKSNAYLFGRRTPGKNGHVFVHIDSDYANGATLDTYQEFLANAVDGQMGIFTSNTASNPDLQTTWVLVSTAIGTAVAEGNQWFIAQMQVLPDGTRKPKTTQTYTYNAGLFKRTLQPYVRPVRQQTTIGYNGTSGTTIGSFTNVAGLSYIVDLVENTYGMIPPQSFNYEYTSTGNEIGSNNIAKVAYALMQLVGTINSSIIYNPTVIPTVAAAALRLNATATPITVGGTAWTFTKGSTTVSATAHGLSAGAWIRVGKAGNNTSAITEDITAPNQARDCYYIKSITSANVFELATPYTGNVENSTISTETVASTNAVSMATLATITDCGITFTAKDFEREFTLATLYGTLNGASITLDTTPVAGSGNPDIVRFFERAGQIYDGAAANYNAQFSDDWGLPNNYTKANRIYHCIELTMYPTDISKGVNGEITNRIHYAEIWIPVETLLNSQTVISGTSVISSSSNSAQDILYATVFA